MDDLSEATPMKELTEIVTELSKQMNQSSKDRGSPVETPSNPHE